MNKAEFFDAKRLKFEGTFNEQINYLLEFIKLLPEDIENLNSLKDELREKLDELAPGLRVIPFGSIVIGLGLKSSDADYHISLPEDVEPTRDMVVDAKTILDKYGEIFTNMVAISSARIPIVNFFHTPTNRKCDINFVSPMGVENTGLLRLYLNMDGSGLALQFALFVKYWAKVHKFVGTNLLGSYALSLMIIFYLQSIELLPSVCEMQKCVKPHLMDGWNVSYQKDFCTNKISDSTSLYDLLGGFFTYYSTFDFENYIISTYTGTSISRNILSDVELIPKEFVYYKQNIIDDSCELLQTHSPMCIQDPFDHSRNCSQVISPRVADRIKRHFQFAAKQYKGVLIDNFIKSILTEDDSSKIKWNRKVQNKVQQESKNIIKPSPKIIVNPGFNNIPKQEIINVGEHDCETEVIGESKNNTMQEEKPEPIQVIPEQGELIRCPTLRKGQIAAIYCEIRRREKIMRRLRHQALEKAARERKASANR